MQMKIELKGIMKSFNGSTVIEKTDLSIKSGNFTTLLGASGCGKTTLLRIIAGLETPDQGEIYFDDTCIFSSEKQINIPPEKRDLGFVFQDFALWPHMTVFENVAFGLRARKKTAKLNENIKNALKAVQLENFAQRYPHQLSGGQQQRVAFARAIVIEPACILFDEPLSALDAVLRDEMRTELKNLVSSLGITSVFVTHDQVEAMSMSDDIVLLNHGYIEQQGTPEEIYCYPKTPFVARFVGRSNWIGETLMFRPEAINFHNSSNAQQYKMKVESVRFLGDTYEICLTNEEYKWFIMSPSRVSPNDEISVSIDKGNILQFD